MKTIGDITTVQCICWFRTLALPIVHDGDPATVAFVIAQKFQISLWKCCTVDFWRNINVPHVIIHGMWRPFHFHNIFT